MTRWDALQRLRRSLALYERHEGDRGLQLLYQVRGNLDTLHAMEVKSRDERMTLNKRNAEDSL